MSESYRLTVHQWALRPWIRDAVDAVLIDIVIRARNRRRLEKIDPRSEQSMCWLHYGTVRAENWLLAGLSDRSLGRRYARLVKTGALLQYVERHKKRGTRVYLGVSPELEQRLRQVEEVLATPGKVLPESGDQAPQMAGGQGIPHDQAPQMAGLSYDTPRMAGGLRHATHGGSESLGESLGPGGLMQQVLDFAKGIRREQSAEPEPPKGEALQSGKAAAKEPVPGGLPPPVFVNGIAGGREGTSGG